MSVATVARHRTALKRIDPSRPIRLALEDSIITRHTVAFDYGCGRGDDMRHLNSLGVRCTGWDPSFCPDAPRSTADVVNLGYVINVIEDASERARVITDAWLLTRQVLIVSARLTLENRCNGPSQLSDGCLTRLGTFQKYYEQRELREWIESVLSTPSVAAAPGVFYVFKDDELRNSFIASRFRQRVGAPRQCRSDHTFERYRTLLEPLMEFITARGRLPDCSELPVANEVSCHLGSVRRAFGVIRRVTGNQQWDHIRTVRSQDLLVYLALTKFGKRPRYSQLPRDIQFDVRAFFGTYKQACELADELLFSAGDSTTLIEACRNSPVGKFTPSSLYIHSSARSLLPAVLRVYEGCARVLVGNVEGANIIKLHHDEPQVSYLAYPGFERDPHPMLAGSLGVHLQTFRVKYREYENAGNPPILHRKEEFLAPEHPLRSKFARLTAQEEHYGLFEKPESIGTWNGWEEVLSEKGLQLRGHRLIRDRRRDPSRPSPTYCRMNQV